MSFPRPGRCAMVMCAMGTSSIELARRLAELASGQAGCFTARQALAIGYADSVHKYHVVNGDWIKCWRGIYRLPEFPQDRLSELVPWLLWSCNRAGAPQGVYCRATALWIHRQGPPPKGPWQMAVPPHFRRNAATPPRLELHKERLAPGDIEQHGPVRVTTLEKTLRDLDLPPRAPQVPAGKTTGIGMDSPSAPAHPYDLVIRRGED